MVTKHKMKNTEIGLLPEDWDVKSLSEIGVFSKGFGITRDQAQSGNIPCIRYGEIYTTHHNYIRRFCSYISQEIANTSTKLKTGDILFAGSGETKEEIGKAVAFVGREDAYAGGDIIILSPKINVSSLFLGFVLNNESSVKQKSSLGQGDAVVHIHAKELAGVLVPFPNHDEQHAIASVLSEMDTMILRLEQAIAKKKLMKDGAMQQLLTGKVRLKGFKEPWVTTALQDIGHFNKTSIDPQQYPETQFIEYSMPAYDNGKMPERKLGVEMNSNRTIIEGQCLLINKLNVRQQRIWLVNQCKENSVCSSEFLPFKSDTCDLAFIGHVMRSPKTTSDLIDMSTGTSNSQRRVAPKDLKAYSVTIPNSKEEQHEIAKILTTMDSEISVLEAERDKYISIKQGIMQKLLTGQIRLPQSCLKEE
jgi:type I restriction enzyme S subunit